MIIALLGPSCSGKTTLQSALVSKYEFSIMPIYTTRKPRSEETENSSDYVFINQEEFFDMLSYKNFATCSKYPENRNYGTLIQDYKDTNENKVVILTPSELRQVCKIVKDNKDFDTVKSVMLLPPVGVRLQRYIDRIQIDNISLDDVHEICHRFDRDFGMFSNFNDVDMTISEVMSLDCMLNQISTTFEFS